jgi:hypothetical protein
VIPDALGSLIPEFITHFGADDKGEILGRIKCKCRFVGRSRFLGQVLVSTVAGRLESHYLFGSHHHITRINQ